MTANRDADKRERTERRATYLTLIGLFLSLVALFSRRERRQGTEVDLGPFDLALLGLATYRAGRLAAYDQVAAPLREPVTETKPDESGAGQTVAAQGTGARQALGELVSCPTCVGTWAAAFLVYGLRIAPRPTRVLLAILGATGVAELLDAASEALAWTARAARKQAGS